MPLCGVHYSPWPQGAPVLMVRKAAGGAPDSIGSDRTAEKAAWKMADGVDHIDIYADVEEEFTQVCNGYFGETVP